MADLAPVVRALNAVQSNAQARAAAGAALTYVGKTYPLIDGLPYLGGQREFHRRALDGARVELEAAFRLIPNTQGTVAIDPALWKNVRRTIERAYIEAVGIEGAAQHKPSTTFWQIMATSIAEAPGVFARGVGTVAAEVGNTAGSVVGGVFAGLGVFWTLALLLVGAALVFGRLKGFV